MTKKLAKIKYLPNNFQILESGNYVVCAVSGKQISLNDLIAHNAIIRNIVRKNIRLRFYSFSLTILFLYIFNNYLYNLNDLNIISNELNTCNLNTTKLNDDLEQCNNLLYINNIGSGYYITMYNGMISRNCFYPVKLYNLCFS